MGKWNYILVGVGNAALGFIIGVSVVRGPVDDLLEKCEEVYHESCSMIPVPDSKESDIIEMYTKWGAIYNG